MTSWTERSGPPATTWAERSAPSATNWTERSAPPTPIPELIVNGGFDSDSVWTKGAGWTIANGVASGPGPAGGLPFGSLSQVITLEEAKAYTVIFTVLNRTTNGIRVNLGGVLGTNRTSNGTFSEEILAGSNDSISFSGTGSEGNTWDGDLDDISVKAVVGDVWTERSDPFVTSWSERSALVELGWLEGPFFLQKQSSEFYEGVRGILGQLTPTKGSDNFYTLAGEQAPGETIFGRREHNFMETVKR
jgi:hypothetical protein